MTLQTVACQSPLSMGFSRQEYWSELPFPSPEHLPDLRIETVSLESPALASMFLTWEDHVRIQRSVKLILAGGLRKLPGGTLY